MKPVGKFVLVFVITYGILIHVALFVQPVERMFFRSSVQHGFTFNRIPDFHAWLKEPSKKPKMLVVGSSTAYRGINPAFFPAFNGFNLSSSSQTPPVSLQLAQHALEADSSIRLILVDLFPYNWDYPNTESVTDLVVNNPFCGHSPYRSMVLKEKNIQLMHLWLYSAYKHSVLKRQPRFEPNNKHETYKGNGFVASDAQLPPIYLTPKDTLAINQYNKKTIHDFIQLSEKYACEVKFILPPQLNRPALDLKGLEINWIDGNEAPLSPSDFIDFHHLNEDGASTYSKWLNDRVVLGN
jgi:hypothetical protein